MLGLRMVYPAMLTLRQEVLSVYREILRSGQKWVAASGKMEDTKAQKEYIKNEARSLFKRNKNLSDEVLIKQHLEEAKTRLTMAIHYRNPYPRPVNLPPQSLTFKPQGKKWHTQEKLRKMSRPIYIKSLDDINDK